MAITLAPVAAQPAVANGANAPAAAPPDGNDSFQAALSRGIENQSAREQAPARPGKPTRHDTAKVHGQEASQAEPVEASAPPFDLVALLAQSGGPVTPAVTTTSETATAPFDALAPLSTEAMAPAVPVDSGTATASATPLALPLAQPVMVAADIQAPGAEPASASTPGVALASNPVGDTATAAAQARTTANDANAPAFALPAGAATPAAQPDRARPAQALPDSAQAGAIHPEPARADMDFRPAAHLNPPRAEAPTVHRPEAQIAHAAPQASARAEAVAAAPSAVALPDAGGAQLAAALPLAASNVAASLPPGFVNAPPLQGRIDAPLNTPAWGQSLNQQISWMVSGAHQSAELQLHPVDLGPVQVVLSIENQKAELLFVAREPAVREALEASLPRLKEQFAAAGIQLGQANVSAEQQPRGDTAQASAQSRRNGLIGDEHVVPAAPVYTVTHRGLIDTFA